MNLRDRLKIRGLLLLFVTVVEKLVSLIAKLLPKSVVNTPPDLTTPKKRRPFKKIVDAIDDIPLPWKNK